MRILHFVPRGSGIRFFHSINDRLVESFKESDVHYLHSWNATDFLSQLSSRIKSPDVVLISAHGWRDSILSRNSKGFSRVISLKNANSFKHKFVFTNSCYSGIEFGPELVNKGGALSYIGFNDTIDSIFEFKNFSGMKYNIVITTIFKRIYTECIAKSIETFIKECQTVEEFAQHLDINFKRTVHSLMKLSTEELKGRLNLVIPQTIESDLKRSIKLEFINNFNELKKKIVICGEKDYICWYYIKKISRPVAENLIMKIEKISEKNDFYKYFILCLIYLRLNDRQSFIEAKLKLDSISESNKWGTFELPVGILTNWEDGRRNYIG